MVMAFAGVAASGTAYVRSNAPVRPASPWSLVERMEALRIDRALPPAVRKQATLSLRGPHAVLKVREAPGPVLLKCPLRADVPEQYLRFATAGAAAQCEAQAADEVGDVLVYEVSGRVSPLCPGQFATLSQQQLHDALFLPALELAGRSEGGAPGWVLRRGRLEPCAAGGANCALSKAASALLYCGVVRTCAEGACFQGSGTDIAPDDVATSLYYYQALAQATAPSTVAPAACGPVPMSVHLSTLVSEAVTATSAAKFIETQPWNAPTLGAPASAETAADLRAFFDRHPRGICLFMRGIDVERAREAEMAAQTLAFPVFAPFDPRLPSRATPLLRSLQRAAFDDEAMGALLGRCEPGAEKACRLKRERMASQLRASVGKLQTPLTNLAADEIPFHIGASGPFHLADSDALHVTLESSAEVPKAKGAHARLMVRYQPLWPESVAEKRLQCLQQPGICLFRALWSLDPPARAADAGEDGFESLVALFGRRDGNTRCVRRLFNALASAGEDRLLELQRDLREPVAAGENRAPCGGRARGLAGLVPPGEGGGHAARAGRAAAKPVGGGAGDGCRPGSPVYGPGEPWAPPARPRPPGSEALPRRPRHAPRACASWKRTSRGRVPRPSTRSLSCVPPRWRSPNPRPRRRAALGTSPASCRPGARRNDRRAGNGRAVGCRKRSAGLVPGLAVHGEARDAARLLRLPGRARRRVRGAPRRTEPRDRRVRAAAVACGRSRQALALEGGPRLRGARRGVLLPPLAGGAGRDPPGAHAAFRGLAGPLRRPLLRRGLAARAAAEERTAAGRGDSRSRRPPDRSRLLGRGTRLARGGAGRAQRLRVVAPAGPCGRRAGPRAGIVSPRRAA